MSDCLTRFGRKGDAMTIIEFGDPLADTVLVQMVDARDVPMLEDEAAKIRELTSQNFRLIAVQVNDWNRDLSPWKAPAVFGHEDFGGAAADTLSEVQAYLAGQGKVRCIGGYSLAGLFALWASCQTDLFQGVAAASPSVWFPGFADYMREQQMRGDTVYLSLGDKEEKARNPVLSTVGIRIREVYDILKEKGVNCTLEWNPGNHFRDAALRTAKAFAWACQQIAQSSGHGF